MSESVLSLSGKYSFNQTIMLKVFSRMNLGTMRFTMPNGEEFYFGNGDRTFSANMRITDNNFFKRCVLYGDIGFAESYIFGEWETDSISNVVSWFIHNRENNPTISGSGVKTSLVNLFRIFNRAYHKKRENTIEGSRNNIIEHYDLGNDFYKLFLDKTMTYSSAIFRDEDIALEEAQIEKYDRLCRQLKLKSTDHILEIGSGWGGFAVHAVKKYGCKVTTITISNEQFKYAKERFEKEGLGGQIEILLTDYRTLTGKYDKIVSIEMLEAVGHKYIPVYFKKCNELLKDNGSLALQVIISPDNRYDEMRNGVDFIQKHIFPGSLLPSIRIINESVNKCSNLNLVDIKDIGLDYAKTLRMWYEEFNKHLPEVKKQGMNTAFIRKWNYYLQYCEAAFRTRNISTVQLVYCRM